MPLATIATFNIRHGRGLDGRVDLERTAAVMRRTGAEVIALQEIDRFHPRSNRIDQPAELQALTGFTVHFLPTLTRSGWEYGIGVAARSPLEDVEAIDLPRMDRVEPRRALAARFRGLVVVATHLAREEEANRAEQVALAADIERRGGPIALVGDLNRRRGRLGPLTALGLRPVRTLGGTLEPWWRFNQIDHVLAGPGVVPGRPRTLGGGASDHRAVTVSLRWSVEDVASVTYDA